MAFTQEAGNVPTSIGTIVVTLKDKPAEGGEPADRSAHFQVDVLDQNGDRYKQAKGNLVPHLIQAQINGLLDFMASIRTQAEEQILP